MLTKFFLHSYACPREINHVPNFQNVLSRSVDIFLRNWTISRRNKYRCGHFNRWIKNVFRTNSKTWAGELSRGSVGRAHFTGPQQAEARSTKILFVRRKFSVELSLATYRVCFGKWLVKRSNTTTVTKPLIWINSELKEIQDFSLCSDGVVIRHLAI